MPHVARPDGASIYYETLGNGFPLLLFAPGGVSSQIGFWRRSAINPIEAFSGDFMVIGMDQRNAGKSSAPLAAVSYDLTVSDQLAVLDAMGATTALVMGGCIGVAYCLRIAKEAPDRIVGAVCQDPVGLDHTNSIDVFMAMFKPTVALAREKGVAAVVESAQRDPLFVTNNEAGPFAPSIARDAAFRDQVLALSADQYVRLIEDYAAGVWPDQPPFMSVEESWVPTCRVPLLVLPGSDPFHPTSVAHRICELAPEARCLDVDCRSTEKIGGTIETIRAFLKEHAGKTPVSAG
jgi:pimeloyl-ACP methyl ester carboxylesterase